MVMHALYRDRRDAGRMVAQGLEPWAGRKDVLVLGLPRGGVPVAYEVARALGAPLDVMIVRKLGMPGQEELALGAIASGGGRILNEELLQQVHLPAHTIDAVTRREAVELARREAHYRGNRPPLDLAGRTIILVDDGLATGSTMLAAVRAVKNRKPARIIIAVPVAPPQTVAMLQAEVEQVICPAIPQAFQGVGQWYDDFTQTSDEEVQALLQRHD